MNTSTSSKASELSNATPSPKSPEPPAGSKKQSSPRTRSKPAAKAVDKEFMQQIVLWLDGLPLSRSRSELSIVRMERDFADGFLIAELISQYYPKLVDLHSYPRASSKPAKRHNWEHLRRKVFSKLALPLSDEDIGMIIESKQGAVNNLLRSIYEIAIRIEAERREAEEERIRASADPLPLEDWKQDVCFIRKDPKGQREVMVTGKLMVPKDLFIKEVECRDMELKELRSANDQMKAQVARLQMTVDLKEDRLSELTHQLSISQRQAQKGEEVKTATPPRPAAGAGGDIRKSYGRNF